MVRPNFLYKHITLYGSVQEAWIFHGSTIIMPQNVIKFEIMLFCVLTDPAILGNIQFSIPFLFFIFF